MPLRLIFLAICTYPVLAIPVAVASMIIGIMLGWDNLAWASLVLGMTGGVSAVIGAFWYFDYKTPIPPTRRDIKRAREAADADQDRLMLEFKEFMEGVRQDPPLELQTRLTDYAREQRYRS